MDDAESAAQGRRLLHVTAACGLEPDRLWWEYFGLGGEVGALEVDAYLHECLWLPRRERELLLRAARVLVSGGTSPRGARPAAPSRGAGVPQHRTEPDGPPTQHPDAAARG